MYLTPNIMLDFETKGTEVDCKVLALGVTVFTVNKIDFTLLESQDWLIEHKYSQTNRSETQSTLDWWETQDKKLKIRIFDGIPRICPSRMLRELEALVNKYIAKYGNVNMWGNGPTFDIAIAEHLFKSYNIPIPWNFWEIRDCRTIKTLIHLLNKHVDDYAVNQKFHDPKADAEYQAKWVGRFMAEIMKG